MAQLFPPLPMAVSTTDPVPTSYPQIDGAIIDRWENPYWLCHLVFGSDSHFTFWGRTYQGLLFGGELLLLVSSIYWVIGIQGIVR